MKKKLIAAVMAASFLLMPLSGCGNGVKTVRLNKKNPVVVSIWHYYNGTQKTAFDTLVTEFNETEGLECGIVVEAFNQGNVTELTDSILASANSEVGTEAIPNIFAAYADTAYQIDKLGLVADLDQYLSKKDLSEYIPSFVEEGRMGSDNALKIFPTAKSTEIFMLNRTDWDKFASEAGASLDDLSTIEGVAATAQRYYEWTDASTPSTPEDGLAFFGRDAMANYFIIGAKQLGVELFAVENGTVTFDLDEIVMRTLWDSYYVPYINGYFVSNGRFRSDDAKVGTILALVGSTTSASYFPTSVVLDDKNEYPIDTLVLPAPCFAQGDKTAVQQGAGMVVTKGTPEQEYASTVFLRWFTQADRNLSFSILSGYLPVKTEAVDLTLLNSAMDAQADQTTFPDSIRQTFVAAIDMITNQSLYTNRAFNGGTSARAVLETSMQTYAAQDRASVMQAIASGESRADAVARYNTDENFQIWLTQLTAALNATQGK